MERLKQALEGLEARGLVQLAAGVEALGPAEADESELHYLERHVARIELDHATLLFGDEGEILVGEHENAMSDLDTDLVPVSQLSEDGYIDGIYVTDAPTSYVFQLENDYAHRDNIRAQVTLLARSLAEYLESLDGEADPGAETRCVSFADADLPGTGWLLDGRGLPCPVEYATHRIPADGEQTLSFASDVLWIGDLDAAALDAVQPLGSQPAPPPRRPAAPPPPEHRPSEQPVEDVDVDWQPRRTPWGAIVAAMILAVVGIAALAWLLA